MKIHEYQGKEIFRKYGIPVPLGRAAFSPQEAGHAAEEIIEKTGSETVVVKAQIHAGGRGKAGGVKVVKGAAAAREAATQLLGKKLVTIQTGPEGTVVRRLFVEQGLAIAKEYYLGLVIDRDTRRVTVMASSEGGVEIEEVAKTHPEKILKETIDPVVGLSGYQARNLTFGLGLSGPTGAKAGKLLQAMTKLFAEEDCSLVEVNPLVVLQDGEVVALDSKINFDENADYRHPDHEGLRDKDEEDATEAEAKAAGLSYVSLQGNIGCLVNGAGLAMSTMDIIKHHGGEPANFLDVGGGASQQAVTQAMRIILSDKDVKGIFVNIFGGIMKCDVIANGVVAATRELGLTVPLVVRLEGTNVEAGRKILAESKLQITPATSMADGAQKIVALVGGK